MFQELIDKLTRHEDLTAEEAGAAMSEIMDGRASEGQIAGFLVLESSPIAEGTPLVHPEFRRRGIGRKLVEAATAACKSRGRRRWLLVSHGTT